jgi:DNA-binding HxlR family transcriptional regulator
MPDPIRKHVSPPDLEHTLFESTSRAAGHVAARFAGMRYRHILSLLNESSACIFELAEKIGCHDHQISGRFGELVKSGLIERTGARRVKPVTGCQCDEYRITMFGIGVLEEASKPIQTEGESCPK